MASTDWKAARPLNELTDLVAIPAIYAFSVDTVGKRLVFGNFTRSVQILALDGDVEIALNRAALDAVGGANRFTVLEGTPFAETMQVPALYIRASAATVAVKVLAVMSRRAVPTGFGELTTANGFDGAGASVALEDLS